MISIHARREEGDPGPCKQRRGSSDFYPRPPRGGRRLDAQIHIARGCISIHALREEGDYTISWADQPKVRFLSTPSARRATWASCNVAGHFKNFYPRPPRGGRPGRPISGPQNTVGFLSTPSARRATRGRRAAVFQRSHFYPRPPRGGRLYNGSKLCRRQKISIHALREEGDSKNREKTLCFCFIIHLPAQIAKRCL